MAKSNSTTDAKDPKGPSEAKQHIAIHVLDAIRRSAMPRGLLTDM